MARKWELGIGEWGFDEMCRLIGKIGIGELGIGKMGIVEMGIGEMGMYVLRFW